MTTTSILPANSTDVVDLPKLANGDSSYINQTTYVASSSVTITYPTAIAVGVIILVEETFPTIRDGRPICTSVFYEDNPSSIFTIIESASLQPPDDIESVLLSYYSLWGAQTPSLCEGHFGGIPSENIPVLSLTETRTVTSQELSAIPFSSEASISQLLLSVSAPLENPRATTPLPTVKPTRSAFPITQYPYTTSQKKAVSLGPAPHVSNKRYRSNELQPVLSTEKNAPGKLPTAGTAGSPVWDSQNSKKFDNPQSNNKPSEFTDSEIVNDGSHDATSESSNDLTVNGLALNRDPSSDLFIGTREITPGAPEITISGMPISLDDSGTAIFVDGSSFPVAVRTNQPAITDTNGYSFTQAPGSEYAFGSQTLVPGGPAITVNGTLMSLAPAATDVVIGGSNFPVSVPTGKPLEIDVNQHSIAKASGSDFIIGSQKLVPGGPAITVNGTLFSLASSATGLVIGTQTEALTISPKMGDIILGGFFSGIPGAPTATNGSTVVNFGGRSFEQCFSWMGSAVILTCF
ncbi:MAG: hypothetical protein Q9167_007897, partial [Letrouitia subvulpina]